MNVNEAVGLARYHMNKNGLGHWYVELTRSNRRLGVCKYRSKSIGLSESFIRLNDENQVLDVILHEIAHALTPGAGHGPVWKAMCRKLGCRPESCASHHRVKAAWKWKLYCRCCQTESGESFRKRRTIYICWNCRTPLVSVGYNIPLDRLKTIYGQCAAAMQVSGR